MLGSDHAPRTLEEKAKPYPQSPSGMPGVQTLVPVMLDHVAKGRLSLERFVDMTSHGPQRLFGLARKGRLAVGYDADVTVVDLKRRETITNAWSASRAAWTPYDGMEVTGWPVGTIVRGHPVMWEGELVGARGAGAEMPVTRTTSSRRAANGFRYGQVRRCRRADRAGRGDPSAAGPASMDGSSRG